MENDSSKDLQLKLRLNEYESERIRKNAAACDKTVSAYVREVAMNMCVVELDYGIIVEHSHHITTIKNALNQLIFTIRKTGNYTPKDLEYILDRMDELYKSEEKLIDEFRKSEENRLRTVAKTTRKIVREKLANKK